MPTLNFLCSKKLFFFCQTVSSEDGLSVLRLYIKQHVKQTICTQNSCSSVRWLMFSIFFTRLAAMSRVVSFFCSEKQTLLLHVCTIQQYGTLFFLCVLEMWDWKFITYIVFQPLNDLNAIVAQIELLQVDKVLKPLNFRNPVALQVNANPMIICCLDRVQL